MRRAQALFCIGILFLFSSVCTYTASCAPVVLVTGFEPFQNYTINPSQLIAEALNGTSLAGADIVGMVLPVDFNESAILAIQAIEQYHPVLVLSVGLAAPSSTIKVEKIGMNLKRYLQADGTWSFPRRIDKNGRFFRVSPLPTKDIVDEMKKAQIPARQSLHAGTYVCNSLLYQLLGYVAAHNLTTKAGFIHVPLLDSQDPQGLPLQTMVTAVTIAIQVSVPSS